MRLVSNIPRALERDEPPVIVERAELDYLLTWHFGRNWWATVYAVAIAASSLTVLLLDYFGRLT